MKPDPEEVAALRKILAEYDEGILSAYCVLGRVQDLVFDQLLTTIGSGGSMISISSHCGLSRPEPPTKTTVTVVFHLEDGKVQAIGPEGWDPMGAW